MKQARPPSRTSLSIVRPPTKRQKIMGRVLLCVKVSVVLGALGFGFRYLPEQIKAPVQSGAANKLAGLRNLVGDTRRYTGCVHDDVGCVDDLFDTLTQPESPAPSLAKTIALLNNAKTSKHPYVMPTFVCVEFAQSLIHEARKHGIPAVYVTIEFADNIVGHAVSAFRTHRGEWFYFDSTSDNKALVKLKEGQRPIFIENFRPSDLDKTYESALEESKDFEPGVEKLATLRTALNANTYASAARSKMLLEYKKLEAKLDRTPRLNLTMGTVKEIRLRRLRPTEVKADTKKWIESVLGHVQD